MTEIKDILGRIYSNKAKNTNKPYVVGKLNLTPVLETIQGPLTQEKLVNALKSVPVFGGFALDDKHLTKEGKPSTYILLKLDTKKLEDLKNDENNTKNKGQSGQTGAESKKETTKSTGKTTGQSGPDVSAFEIPF